MADEGTIEPGGGRGGGPGGPAGERPDYAPVKVWVGDKMHSFPAGTPLGVIQAEMSALYPSTVPPSTPGAPPGGAPLRTTGEMPRGTTPGGMVTVPGAPDATIPTLSPEAERMRRLMALKAFRGDEKGAGAAQHVLQSDPTYQARTKAADVLGQTAGEISKKQQLAQQALGYIEDWRNYARAWSEHNPKAFENAIGYWQSDPRVLGYTASNASYEFGKGQQHYYDALGQLVSRIAAGGPNSEGNREAYEKAISLATQQRSFQGFDAVMDAVADMMRGMGQLPHDFQTKEYRPLTPANIDLINKYSGGKKINVGSRYDPYQLQTPAEAHQVPQGSYFLAPNKQLVYRAASMDEARALPPGSLFVVPDADNNLVYARVRRSAPPGAAPATP